MTTTDTRSTKELFRQWRSGDAAAGNVMAQRFADWYYAVATSRLGEQGGREPCERACARFGEGVTRQGDARALVKWAHELIQEEVATKGARMADGDEASSYTGGQRPKDLLVRARDALPAEVKLLEDTYAGRPDSEPISVLKARYRVKQWLRDNAKVKFDIAPTDPVLDRAPLPLYESGRMASAAEEANFEQWMLSDLDLCKDIAEFAVFAIALRGGLPATSAKPQGSQKSSGGASGNNASDGPAPQQGVGGMAAVGGVAVVVGGLFVVGLLGALILVALYFAVGS